LKLQAITHSKDDVRYDEVCVHAVSIWYIYNYSIFNIYTSWQSSGQSPCLILVQKLGQILVQTEPGKCEYHIVHRSQISLRGGLEHVCKGTKKRGAGILLYQW